MPVIGPAKSPQPSYAAGYAKSASESAHPNLWDGLVGAWMPSLGVTGDTLRDVSGNGNHGTLTNMDAATDWVTTSKGLALDFDGIGDHASIPDSPVFKLGFSDFSAFALIYYRKGINADDCIFEFRGNGGSYSSWVWFINSSDKLQVWKPSLTSQSTDALAENKWHHLGIVRKNNIVTFFIDAKASGASAWTESADSDSSGIRIATRQDSTNSLNAELHSAQLYNRALTPDEIQTLYVDSLAPFRKKQQVAFNAYPLTLLQKIRSAAKPTTPVSVRVKHNEEPSYKAGYAKSASESANPKLWDGLVSAFVPSFGVTGETLHDLTASNNDGIIYHQNRTINEVWTKTKVGPAVSTYPSGGFQGITTPANNLSMDEFTIVANVRFENRYPGTYPCITVKENNYLDRNWFLGMFPDEEIAFVRSMSGDRWVKSGVVPNKTDFYSIAATSSKVLSHAIYVNGELKNSAHYTGTRSVAGNQNYIGIYRDNNNYPTGGSISCILYYSRILSPSEIKHLYADPLAPFRRKKSPIGYQPNKELKGLIKT